MNTSLAALLREKLSDQQRESMVGTANVFLRACPGSGKTLSVAARVAWRVNEKKSIALISYTRVGAREIAQAAASEFGVLIPEDCFSGTIHSFLLKYVLRPFGHLVAKCESPLEIDADAVE